MLDTSSRLVVLCARLHRALVAERLQALGLASGEDLILAELWREDGLTQTELARRLRLRRPTVTVVLNRMERHGLVTRAPDLSDRRVVRISHTQRSAELLPELNALWRNAEHELLSCLSDAELAQLRSLLARVVDRSGRSA